MCIIPFASLPCVFSSLIKKLYRYSISKEGIQRRNLKKLATTATTITFDRNRTYMKMA